MQSNSKKNAKSFDVDSKKIQKLKISKSDLSKLKGGALNRLRGKGIIDDDICYSDKRLKKNIESFDGGLEEIMKIRIKKS